MALRICDFDGCGRSRHSAGLCSRHSRQKKDGVELTQLPPKTLKGGTKGNCRIPTCDAHAKARGLCQTHYEAWRHGEPDWAKPRRFAKRRNVAPVVLNFQPLISTWVEMAAEIKRTGLKPHHLVRQILDEWAFRRRNGRDPGQPVRGTDEAWRREDWEAAG